MRGRPRAPARLPLRQLGIAAADGAPDPQDWFDCFAIVFSAPGAPPVLVLSEAGT